MSSKNEVQGKMGKLGRNIFSSIRIPIQINGSSTKKFSLKRGIRQGDPLSPLLFLLTGQILHCMLEEEKEKGIFKEIVINEEGDNLSHLQFTDDTILILKNDLHSVLGLKRVLQCF